MDSQITLPIVDAPTSPLARLQAIRQLAHFAQVHDALGEATLRCEDLTIPEREDMWDKADAHFLTHETAVGQLIALICDDEAGAQMDVIEARCASEVGAVTLHVPQAWTELVAAYRGAHVALGTLSNRHQPQTERDRATVAYSRGLDRMFACMTRLERARLVDRAAFGLPQKGDA